MSMSALIRNTLLPLGQPVGYMKAPTGSPDTYFIYTIYNEAGEVFADDAEISTGYLVQVDIFSKSNFNQLAKDAKASLIAVGFIRMYSNEEYVQDMSMYRKIMRYRYGTKIGEEL